MSNLSKELYIALKELLNILDCSKCEINLHHRKFLKCDHISCNSYINKNNIACLHCQCYLKRDDIENNDNIEKIIQICCNIAQIVGFTENIENIEKTIKGLPKHNFNLSLKNLKNIKSDDSLNQCEKEPLKKLRNYKKSILKEYPKKTEENKNGTNLCIPKKINKRNYHGETKLHEECKKGHIENVKFLLKLGANPNIACNANWTALQECADYGFYDIVKILLECGANVNQQGYDGRTALHEAAKNNNLYMTRLLLKYNAKKDLLDMNGKKPIDYCTVKELKVILKSDSKSNTQNSDIESNIENHNDNTQQTKPNSTNIINANIIDIKNVKPEISSKKRKITDFFHSEYKSKNNSDINKSNLENEIEIIFEKIRTTTIHNEYIDDNKDNIFNKTPFISNIINIDEQEGINVDGGYFEDIKNTAFKESKFHILSNSESEEIIDIMN